MRCSSWSSGTARIALICGWGLALGACLEVRGEDVEAGPQEDGCLACHHAGETDSKQLDEESCGRCHHRDAGGILGFQDGMECAVCHHADAGVPGELKGCDTCHGFPPTSVAHPVHLAGGELHKTMDCKECHVVPGSWFDGDHLNAVVEVPFPDGGLAGAGGLRPSWDGRECQNVYCHGASLADGPSSTPPWKDGDVQCGGCHGVPPAAPHPESGECTLCHGGAYTGSGTLDPAKHINGALELGEAEDEEGESL